MSQFPEEPPKISKGQTLPPRVEYFKLTPSTSRYYQIMAFAAKRKMRWQEVIREAIDFYLMTFSKEV